MHKETYSIWSNHLKKEMEIASYGHYGLAILLFPSLTDNYLENETNGLIDAFLPFVKKGKCKVFSIGGVMQESWLNPSISSEDKSNLHFDYNNFIVEEILPFIFNECNGPIPTLTCGAANGAYYAANNYFRRPDLFHGTIAMSGTYNIQHYSDGFYNDNCYFNSPVHYLPNLTDNYWLSFLMSKHHVYLMSGQNEGEFPENSINLQSRFFFLRDCFECRRKFHRDRLCK